MRDEMPAAADVAESEAEDEERGMAVSRRMMLSAGRSPSPSAASEKEEPG